MGLKTSDDEPFICVGDVGVECSVFSTQYMAGEPRADGIVRTVGSICTSTTEEAIIQEN